MAGLLKSIFLWFYRLDLPEATFLVLAATLVFCYLNNRFSGKGWWTGAIAAMLGCVVLVIAFETVSSRSSSDVLRHNFVPFHSYREVLSGGSREIYRSNFMNVMLFYPAGLLAASLLPRKWPGWCRCLSAVLVLAALSAGIEFLQYRYALGRCEIDDAIHNTFGALLGSLGAVLIPPFLLFLKSRLPTKQNTA